MQSRRARIKQSFKDYAVATVLAGVCVLIVGGAFRPKKRAKNGSASHKQKILSISYVPAEVAENHKHLLQWLELEDPALIPLPGDSGLNRAYPSRIWIDRPKEFVPPREPYASLPAGLEVHGPYRFPMRPVVRSVVSLDGQHLAAQVTQIPFAPAPALPPAPNMGIYWVNEFGKPVEGLPRQDNKSLEGVALEAKQPTVFSVEPRRAARSGLVPPPRIRIIQTSGNRALDQTAFQHLSRYLVALSARRTDSQFGKWMQGPRRITTLWHRVPDMKYKPELEVEKETN